MISKIRYVFPIVLLILLVFIQIPSGKASAGTSSSISFGSIDYDAYTLQVFNNGNSIVYYSTDKSNWYEVESMYDSSTASYTMDIAWIADTKEVTLYFKGNTVTTIKSITLPMKNSSFSVTFNKAEGDFTFDNTEESQYFEWRKSTDYNWSKVSLDEDTSSYQEFLKTVNTFRVMGAKIYIRTPQIIGSGSNSVGCRPSKEVQITIPKRANAPTIKVNLAKLTLNTTEAMEYYDTTSDLWIGCSSSMSLEDIAPTVLYRNGGKKVTISIRTAETDNAPYSKTANIMIAGQVAPPVIGDDSANVTYYYMNSKLTMQFHSASKSTPYEYTVVKADDTFDTAKATWRTVTNSNIMTISTSTAPNECKIYIRKKGVDSTLPSATASFTVKYPQA